MLVYPAAEQSGLGVFLVALVFGIATIGTMLLVVCLVIRVSRLLSLKEKNTGYICLRDW